MPYRIALVLMLWASALTSCAQNTNPGNWLMYFGQNRVSDKLSLHTEVQYRNHTVVPNNIEQLLLRGGLNYHFSPNALATVGYGHITGYVYDSESSKPEVTEHRIWQQLITTQLLGRVKFEHRYRLEQRWVNEDYKNRFRYRLMLFVPFNKPQLGAGTLFAGVYDEVFINGKKTFFDRNRLYGALGYQFNASTSVQVGMLHQQVNDFGKWYLQFAVVFNPDFRSE